jgi:hypothetical protein
VLKISLGGSIIANGRDGSGGGTAGAGSGSGVNIVTGTLTGDGFIQANVGNERVGGGGGRVAVRYNTLGIDGNHLTTTGGVGSYGTIGQPGTVSLGLR